MSRLPLELLLPQNRQTVTASVQLSSTATASVDNLRIHKSLSRRSEPYFMVFNILKDIPVQFKHCFFFFFCDWWPTSEGSLIFISTIYLKDTDKRKLGRPALLSHLHLLLTDCFCHRSKLLAWLLAGIVFLNYQQKNQTQASGNTYSANQPDSVLASGAHFLIWSDLLQDRSPLTELSFTSEGVIEWRKINGGINKSNHRIAPANLKHFNIWVSSVIVGGKGCISWFVDIDRKVWQFEILDVRLMLIGFSVHPLTPEGHRKLGWAASYPPPIQS